MKKFQKGDVVCHGFPNSLERGIVTSTTSTRWGAEYPIAVKFPDYRTVNYTEDGRQFQNHPPNLFHLEEAEAATKNDKVKLESIAEAYKEPRVTMLHNRETMHLVDQEPISVADSGFVRVVHLGEEYPRGKSYFACYNKLGNLELWYGEKGDDL